MLGKKFNLIKEIIYISCAFFLLSSIYKAYSNEPCPYYYPNPNISISNILTETVPSSRPVNGGLVAVDTEVKYWSNKNYSYISYGTTYYSADFDTYTQPDYYCYNNNIIDGCYYKIDADGTPTDWIEVTGALNQKVFDPDLYSLYHDSPTDNYNYIVYVKDDDISYSPGSTNDTQDAQSNTFSIKWVKTDRESIQNAENWDDSGPGWCRKRIDTVDEFYHSNNRNLKFTDLYVREAFTTFYDPCQILQGWQQGGNWQLDANNKYTYPTFDRFEFYQVGAFQQQSFPCITTALQQYYLNNQTTMSISLDYLNYYHIKVKGTNVCDFGLKKETTDSYAVNDWD